MNEFGLEDIPIKQCGNAFSVCVCIEMIKRGTKVKGFDVVFVDDVLLGIVLSSLAAVESCFGFALNNMYNLGFDHLELV